jgi:hypothetical protein
MKRVLVILSSFILIYGGAAFALATSEVTQPATSPASTVNVTTPEPIKATETPKQARSQNIRFRDVPSDHWATSSVYDLVNLGVTQGYPDGTFRGNNYITRFETAVWLSKLANSIGQNEDKTDIAIEKLKDELRAEIRSIRADIAELKRMPEETDEKPISGYYQTKLIFGNLVASNTSVEGETAPTGPLVRYRLKTTFAKAFGEGAKLKINIDTMDSGFGGGSSDLSTKILDIEGKIKLNMGLESPVDVTVTSGPGPVVHTEEADSNGNYIARSERGVVYLRPYNSIMFASKFIGMDVGMGYIARNVTAFGEVEVNQVNANFALDIPMIFIMPQFKLTTNIDYLTNKPQSSTVGPTDTKYTFDALFATSQKHRSKFTYSVGKGESPHNAMFAIQTDFVDMWDTGTYLTLKYRKVGSEYLQENDILDENLFAGLDVFDRYIGNGNSNGVVDVGASLSQVITENVRLISKVDWRLAADNSYDSSLEQCTLVMDGGVQWDIATDTLLETIYRVESIPSADDVSTDIVQFSLSFKY